MSKETKFTEGVWGVEQCDLPIAENESECYYILNDEGNCIADVYIQDDAHLIKTAAKLYEMLESDIEELKLGLTHLYKRSQEYEKVIDEIYQKESLLAEARGE